MIIGERIKKLRNYMDITQQEFASHIGLKQNSIALIETGKRNMSNQVILSICREFNVNEKWLRTGEGEMINNTHNTNVAKLTNILLSAKEDDFKKRFIDVMANLSPEQWQLLEEIVDKLAIKRGED